MASSPERQNQKNVITLRTPEGLQATVNPHGAYLESLTAPDGQELLFPRQDINGKDRGGIPVCAPIFGPGATVGLKQHGFARNLAWEPVESKVSKDFARFFLDKPRSQNTADIHENYAGCEMGLQIDLRSDKNGSNALIMNLNVRNTGGEPFVLAPGFHPYFLPPSGETVDIHNKTTRDYSLDKHDLATAKELDSTHDKVWSFNSGGREVTISTYNLSTPIVWTESPDKYVCIEPTAAGPATREGGGSTELLKFQPGRVENFTMRIDWSPPQTT